jgi:hypothetical protein
VAASALGFESEIILNISVDPARLDDVAHELASYVGVRYLAASVNGSLICEVIMPTTDDLYRFLTQGLGKIDGVRDWTANVELLTIKRGFLETPWSREGEADVVGPDDDPVDELMETSMAVAAVGSDG